MIIYILQVLDLVGHFYSVQSCALFHHCIGLLYQLGDLFYTDSILTRCQVWSASMVIDFVCVGCIFVSNFWCTWWKAMLQSTKYTNWRVLWPRLWCSFYNFVDVRFSDCPSMWLLACIDTNRGVWFVGCLLFHSLAVLYYWSNGIWKVSLFVCLFLE